MVVWPNGAGVCPSISRNTPDPSGVVCKVKSLSSIAKLLYSNPRSMVLTRSLNDTG